MMKIKQSLGLLSAGLLKTAKIKQAATEFEWCFVIWNSVPIAVRC